jgi:hypothetical protein
MTIRLRAGMTITQHTMDGTAISGVYESLIHSSFISDHLVYCEGLYDATYPLTVLWLNYVRCFSLYIRNAVIFVVTCTKGRHRTECVEQLLARDDAR